MLNDVIELTQEIIESGEPYKISMLNVSGNDIIQAGIASGQEVGRTLEHLLQLVIDDPSLNNKDALLQNIPQKRNGK